MKFPLRMKQPLAERYGRCRCGSMKEPLAERCEGAAEPRGENPACAVFNSVKRCAPLSTLRWMYRFPKAVAYCSFFAAARAFGEGLLRHVCFINFFMR